MKAYFEAYGCAMNVGRVDRAPGQAALPRLGARAFAWIVLDEVIGWVSALGSVITVVGVVILSRK